MTNIIILSFSIFFTNSFPYGATLPNQVWASNTCNTVQMTYIADAAGICVVEGNYYVRNRTTNGNIFEGDNYGEMNNARLVNGEYYNYLNGYYTNEANVPKTIVFPSPPLSTTEGARMFFRLKEVYPPLEGSLADGGLVVHEEEALFNGMSLSTFSLLETPKFSVDDVRQRILSRLKITR